jgi:hypothetical protein
MTGRAKSRGRESRATLKARRVRRRVRVVKRVERGNRKE